MENKTLKFPDGFLWGAATAAHQVEGANLNDWTEWEKKNAKRLAGEAGNKWAGWQKEKFPEMFDPENYISGRACDHYHRYEEDLDIAKSLSLNAFRISIEWSRIEPEDGKFDEREIEHYRKVLEAIRARGMEPFVTLCHYTIPIWFYNKGGWENKKSPEYFTRFAKKVSEEYKNLVKFWVTFNEPILLISGEYIKGYRPPQKKIIFLAFRVWKNIAEAHKSAYVLIHEANPEAQVGFSEWLNFFDDRQAMAKTGFLSWIAKYFANERMIRKVLGHLDFIGAQHYIRIPFSARAFFENENRERSDVGWGIVPEGMYQVLMDLKKYNLPIYITENGIADSDDKHRAEFIRKYLAQVYRAMKDGVDVRGYFHWSLLDNFEWQSGFWPRFGLVEVNYKTMERKVRPSAWKYAKICKENELEL
ncbi:MAG: glycoside hydrolase family 1 protein [Candidatus Moranbacteria bacterium]|nr:glycoside hydrolase family 1 protein [Candidatus Moranbacteria bacterium]